MVLNLIKILLIMTLLLDHGQINIPVIEETQFYLIFVSTLACLLGFINETLLLLIEFKNLLQFLFTS